MNISYDSHKNFLYKKIALIFSILLLLLSLLNIKNSSQIFVLHDEFGYWYNAANIAGYDWTGISGISPFYSYGYSLLLVPLFLIFNSSVAMYRAAIILNGLLLVGSYLLSCKCAFHFFSTIKREWLVFFCFIASCYGGFIFSVNVTWGEPLLLFIFWLLILTLIKFELSNSILYLFAASIEVTFAYTIHQRALALLVAFGIICVLYFIQRHISWKKLLLCLLIFLGILLGIFLFKNNLVSSLWNTYLNQGTGAANTYGGQLQKIILFFTSSDFFISVIEGFFSKFFYLFAASGLLILWGIYHILKNLLIGYKQKISFSNIYLFCLLSVIFLEGISALYFNQTTRLDTIIYGRYVEFSVGPLLLFGICSLYQEQKSYKLLIVGIGIYLTFSLFAIGPLFHGSGNMFLSSVVGNLFYDISTEQMNTGYLIVVPLLIGVFLFILFQYRRRFLYILAFIPLTAMWLYSVHYTLKVDVNPSQAQAEGYLQFADNLDDLGEDLPIYFIYREEYGSSNWPIERIQTILYDRKIQIIQLEDVAALSGDYILLQYSLNDIDMDQFTVYAQTHGIVAAVPNNSSLYEAAINKQYEFSSFDPADRVNAIGNYADRISLSSNHQKGFLTSNNYMSLNAGTYEVKIKLHAEEITGEALGAYDVTINQGNQELIRNEFFAADFDINGDAEFTFTFTCENSNFVEYRIYSYDTSVLTLESMVFRRIQ